MNVYQKLAKARTMFLASDAKKTGKNMTLAFKYFELDDIVPVVTKIFEEVGLISVVKMDAERASMWIVNTEDPENTVAFTAPMIIPEGNRAVTPIQALGAAITYYRRYLYMMALDICEPDSIDPVVVDVPKAPPVTTSPVEPKEKSLTDADGNASELQIKQMKELLKKLREADPSKEDWIAQIAVDTKGFTVISKSECEALVKEINAEIKGGQA